MLIVPDRLKKFTGLSFFDQNKNFLGSYVTYAPFDNARKCKEASGQAGYLWPIPNGFSNELPVGGVKEETVENAPQEYFLIKKLSWRYDTWLVKNDKNEYSIMYGETVEDAIHCDITGGLFRCSFVWVYDSGKTKLVRAGGDKHARAIEEVTRRKTKPLNKNKLEIGGIYQDLAGREGFYVGNLVGRGMSFVLIYNYTVPITKLADIFKTHVYVTRMSPRVKTGQVNCTFPDIKDYIVKNKITDYGVISTGVLA